MTEINYWHEFPSNFSNGTSVDGIGTFIQYANSGLNGSLGGFILFATWLISFLALKAFSFTKAFSSSMFLTFIISVFLMRLEMIPIQIVIGLGIALAIGILLARQEARQGL